jgi:hypothetical protein
VNGKLNDEKFLRMLEAMYEDQAEKLAIRTFEYDECAYQGWLQIVVLKQMFNLESRGKH